MEVRPARREHRHEVRRDPCSGRWVGKEPAKGGRLEAISILRLKDRDRVSTYLPRAVSIGGDWHERAALPGRC